MHFYVLCQGFFFKSLNYDQSISTILILAFFVLPSRNILIISFRHFD